MDVCRSLLLPSDVAHIISAVGHQSSTLTCYIASLPTATPFRVSLHSWAPVPKPSAVIEAQRNPNQRILYQCQIVVNEVKALYFADTPASSTLFLTCRSNELFEPFGPWPQEISTHLMYTELLEWDFDRSQKVRSELHEEHIIRPTRKSPYSSSLLSTQTYS
jgi:hypothetical protein